LISLILFFVFFVVNKPFHDVFDLNAVHEAKHDIQSDFFFIDGRRNRLLSVTICFL